MYAIETEQLSRRFGTQTGVDGINLQVPAGAGGLVCLLLGAWFFSRRDTA